MYLCTQKFITSKKENGNGRAESGIEILQSVLDTGVKEENKESIRYGLDKILLGGNHTSVSEKLKEEKRGEEISTKPQHRKMCKGKWTVCI